MSLNSIDRTEREILIKDLITTGSDIHNVGHNNFHTPLLDVMAYMLCRSV